MCLSAAPEASADADARTLLHCTAPRAATRHVNSTLPLRMTYDPIEQVAHRAAVIRQHGYALADPRLPSARGKVHMAVFLGQPVNYGIG